MKNVPHASIRWLVGNIHVGTSFVQVVREFVRRLMLRDKMLQRGFIWKADKATRKAIYRYALKCHRENRQLCIDFRL